ncbi:MAG: helix-turn-helix domain-containing protein [Oscillospiraceae bacterium]|nr:helix-turn-helix domain-containing protein [Oscillospiraceae bacterium]
MKNLKKLRLDSKMTQLSLQMRTGIDQSLLSKYEKGERLPTVETLTILADYFDTSLDYLMGRTAQRKPYPR